MLKEATKEVAQIYAELVKRGIGLKYLDVGGGLGVNYDKGHFEEDAGINYSLEEYANAVVFTVKEVCDVERGADADARHGERPRAHGASLGADRARARRAREGRSEPGPHGARDRGRAAARAEQDPRGAAEDAQAIASCSRRSTT